MSHSRKRKAGIGIVVAHALALSACVGPARPRRTLEALVAAPSPSGAPLEERDLGEGRAVREARGMHAGHRVLSLPIPAIGKEPFRYALRYNVCFEKSAHPGMVDVWPREGLCGIGLSRPTGANWYSGGFIDVRVNGRSCGPYRARFKYRKLAAGEEIEARWDTPEAEITLVFSTRVGHDPLFVRGKVEPKGLVTSVEVRLSCHPGGFTAPRDRTICTVSREFQRPSRVLLRPSECWLVCLDRTNDVATHPAAQGPAAFAFVPAGIKSVRVTGGGSSAIAIHVSLLRRSREFHLALWEFPKWSNADAIAYMRTQFEGVELASASAVRARGVRAGTIAEDGKPTASIVIPRLASDTVRVAAEEVRDYVAEISGALLPVVTDERRVRGNRILVGMTRFTPRRGLDVSADDPGKEGFVLRTDGRDVLIVGSDDAGTLYGAWEFLERLGVRWYLEDPLGEVVPQRSTIRVPALDERQRPDFRMRWVGRGEWCLRNKGNRAGKSDPCGLRMLPGSYPYHGMYRYLPSKEYFPTHPEYFALIKGKRSDHKDAKPCTTNPDVVREVAKNMAKALDEHPDTDLIVLSPKDGLLYCECERCRALDEPGATRNQSMSRRILTFYNQVAEELVKTHPKARILAGAYSLYNEPPLDKSLKAHPNLALVICHYNGYCLMHPINDPKCPLNARFRELLAGWRRLIPEIYLYEYYYTDGWRGLPCPLVHTVAADIPYLKQTGSGGLYTQYSRDSVWQCGLTYYVAAKLLWNAQTDVGALLDEFYDKFFEHTAEPMKGYYTALEEAVASTTQHICTTQNSRPHEIFTPDLLQRLEAHLAQARGLAQSAIVKARLARVAVSLDYTRRFVEYRRLRERAVSGGSPEERAKAAREALDALEALHKEVTEDRAKYAGIVAARPYHWRYEFRSARRLVAKYASTSSAWKALRGKVVAELPRRWRFRLDKDNKGLAEKWFAAALDDSKWPTIETGRHWEDQGYQYDGYAWYRARLGLSAKQAAKPLAIAFGGVDAEAWVYWNGQLVGHHDGWDEPFVLPVKKEFLRTDAPNVIAVRVYDRTAKGGIYGRVQLIERAKAP